MARGDIGTQGTSRRADVPAGLSLTTTSPSSGDPNSPPGTPKCHRTAKKADGLSVEDFLRYIKVMFALNVPKSGYTGHLRGRGEEQWQRGAISGQ